MGEEGAFGLEFLVEFAEAVVALVDGEAGDHPDDFTQEVDDGTDVEELGGQSLRVQIYRSVSGCGPQLLRLLLRLGGGRKRRLRAEPDGEAVVIVAPPRSIRPVRRAGAVVLAAVGARVWLLWRTDRLIWGSDSQWRHEEAALAVTLTTARDADPPSVTDPCDGRFRLVAEFRAGPAAWRRSPPPWRPRRVAPRCAAPVRRSQAGLSGWAGRARPSTAPSMRASSSRISVTTRTAALVTLGGATTASLALIPGPMPLLVGLAILAGVAWGNLAPLQATAVTDRWGTIQYGRLSGLVGAPGQIAAALVPWASAALPTSLGGYSYLFAALAVLSAVAARFALVAPGEGRGHR